MMLSISFAVVLDYFQQSFWPSFLPWSALGAVVLCWRLWRFTIIPVLKPKEPKELPYWIPCALIMTPVLRVIELTDINRFWYHGRGEKTRCDLQNVTNIIDRPRPLVLQRLLWNAREGKLTHHDRKYFKSSKDPYSLWIAGSRIYVCSSPEDVAGLLANTTTITMHSAPKELLRWLGVSQGGFSKLFHLDPSAKHNIDMGRPQVPAWMIDEFHRRQLKPGPLLDDLLYKRVIPDINQILDHVADGSSPSVISKSGNGITVSLLHTCIHVFVGGLITSFLGDQILGSNPALVDSFITWERTSWKYMFKLPKMLSRDMLNARDVMIDTFVKYLSMPAERRGDAAYFTKTTESMLKDVGCNNQDIARVLVFHFWTILGNVHKVSFWILAYMAYDASLLERIRNEVSPAIKDGQLNEPYVAKSCPYLDSLISEVTRLTVASALGRDVIGPTPVGDKILQSGSKVLLPVHQLHLDSSVWGEDPSRMNPDRFVRDPKLYSSRSYRPFGGGHSLCPGRFFAKRIIAYAVAAMVTKFDIHIDIDRTRESVGAKRELGQTKATGIDSINFPRVDLSTPSPGASLPAVQGEDVFLILGTK